MYCHSHPSTPGFTLCFCTGLYAAAVASRRLLFLQELFVFLSSLVGLMALTYRLPD